MNQRIKLLAEQCRLKSYGINGELLDVDFDEEKFAQLIVEECAAIALKSGNINNKSMQAKVEAERIYHKIKEHFGVEE
jgi:hypothetical protein